MVIPLHHGRRIGTHVEDVTRKGTGGGKKEKFILDLLFDSSVELADPMSDLRQLKGEDDGSILRNRWLNKNLLECESMP